MSCKKRTCRTVGLSLAASVVPLSHHRNVANLSLFHRYYFGRHCVKSVSIRSYSGLHFPTFGLNTERYGVSLRIQSECGKMRTRIIPNTDIFHAVRCLSELAELVPLPHSRGRSTRYSDRLNDFSVSIHRCYKDVYLC